LTGVKLNLDF